MTSLKRALFWVAFFLGVIFILGQLDRADRPVINLASYFYILVFVAIPCVVLIPSFYKAPQVITLIFWASIYFALSRILDRSLSAPETVETILIELILLELGVWLAIQLARDIANSESLLDSVAQSAFPNIAIPLDAATERISNEINRSRRYRRPISLIVIRTRPENLKLYQELFRNFRRDLLNRFSFARMAQLIGERIRQTDVLLMDRSGHFLVLCPETDIESAVQLGERINSALEEGTGLVFAWGASSFPEEALTFEDLIQKAREQIRTSSIVQENA